MLASRYSKEVAGVSAESHDRKRETVPISPVVRSEKKKEQVVIESNPLRNPYPERLSISSAGIYS